MVKSVKLVELMEKVAFLIDDTFKKAFGKKTGFVLLTFSFGDEGNKAGHYISNGKREDIIVALREMADRLEKNEVIEETTGGIH